MPSHSPVQIGAPSLKFSTTFYATAAIVSSPEQSTIHSTVPVNASSSPGKRARATDVYVAQYLEWVVL